MKQTIAFTSLDVVSGIIAKYSRFEEMWEDWEIGNFITKDGDKWITLANETGDAWVEEFDTLEEAVNDLIPPEIYADM